MRNLGGALDFQDDRRTSVLVSGVIEEEALFGAALILLGGLIQRAADTLAEGAGSIRRRTPNKHPRQI